jgi:hypothetical protein
MRKTLKIITLTFILPLIGFSFFINKNQNTAIEPPASDMVFIKGQNDMESFYMSVTEEPNINYIIYLQWLDLVYGGSYPEVFTNALPNTKEYGKLYQFNDPQIENYMTHPAFSYYPVVGLSYDQIQNYLIWKTDRLNESILIGKGIQIFTSEQKDADSFNTEAYLIGQYLGLVRKDLIDKKTKKERPVIACDDIFKPSFRLPTEVEWVYASQFQKQLDPKRYLKPFSSKSINNTLGKNYYTISWSRQSEEFRKLWGHHDYDEFNQTEIFTYKVDGNGSEKGFDFKVENDKIINGNPSRLTSIGDYDPKSFGLANMYSGVKELLFDAWEGKYDSTLKNTFKIFEKNKAVKGLKVDANNQPVEKDPLGHVKGLKKAARFLGVDDKGEPIYWSFQYAEKPIATFEMYLSDSEKQKSYVEPIKRVVRGGTWKNPNTTQREAILETESSGEVGFRVVMPYIDLSKFKK